ncbi:MAG TPA: EXLDI protein [Bacillota bacterium]|nr:EXLDI protein [Bacillota bacterium]
MPNKTIYVSEKDLDLYNRAQELFDGNLSAAITKALRMYVDWESDDQDDFEKELHDVVVVVGKQGSKWRQKFIGRQLIKWKDGSESDPTHHVYRLYITQKGQYAIHIEVKTSRYLGSHDFMSMSQDEDQLNVFKSWEDAKDEVPNELHHVVQLRLDGEDAEFLDI